MKMPTLRPRYRPQLELLEDRTVLSAVLDLLGSQTLLPRGNNVNVTNTPDIPPPFFAAGLPESEFQIAINPSNPLNIVGASNIPIIQTGIGVLLGVYRSFDGGQTWQTTFLGNANDGLGTAGSRFDPTLRFDANGNLFIAYGYDDGNRATLVAARSTDGGTTFTQFRNPTAIDDTNGVPGVDKYFLTTGLDPSTGRQAVYIAYTWNSPGILTTDQKITIVGSNDGGNSYTQPLTIDDDDGSLFAGPAVGPNGELYVVWHDFDNGQIKIDRDLDGLWANTFQFGHDVGVAALRESFISKTTPANPARGMDNGPSIDVSRTGPFHGRIYVAYTDTFNGNDTDIYLTSSDDNGATWTPVGQAGNVESSTGTDFMPTVAVDQTSGSVNIGYYTTDGDQTDPDGDGVANDDVNYRVASSTDGGASWSYQILTTATSRASAMRDVNEFGDYEGLAVYAGTIHALWCDNRGPVADNEGFTATASFQSASNGNTLNVVGTDAADTIEITSPAQNPAYVRVMVNGQNEYTGLWASINQIVINGQDGNDQIFIESDPPGVPVTVNGGGGDDTIDLAGYFFEPTWGPRDLAFLASRTTVDGGSGNNTIFLSDQAGGSATTTIDSTTISQTSSGFGGLTYSSVAEVDYTGSNLRNTYDVESTPINTTVTLELGDGTNDVTISPTAQNLDGIQGPVTVDGNGGTPQLTVDDQADAYSRTHTVTSSSVTRTSAATVSYFNLPKVTLNGASAAAQTYDVSSTLDSCPVDIFAGSQADIFNVGYQSPTSNNLSALFASLTLHGGGGGDSLNVNDHDFTAGDTYTWRSNTLKVQRLPHFTLTYDGINSAALQAGSGTDQFVVDLGGGNPFPPGGLSLDGGPGNNQLAVQGKTAFTQETFLPSGFDSAALQFSSPASPTPSVLDFIGILHVDDTSSRLAPTLEFAFNGTEAGDTVNIGRGPMVHGVSTTAVSGGGTYPSLNLANKSRFTVRTGAGNDVISLGGNAHVLAGFMLPYLIDGGADVNTLNVSDQGSPSGGIYTLTATTVTRKGLSGTRFSNIAVLNLTTSDQADTVYVQSIAKGVNVQVHTGAGDDSVSVGSSVNLLAPIMGPLTLDGGTDPDRLNLNNQGTTAAHSETLTATQLHRGPAPLITYSLFQTLNLNSGLNEHLTVQSTPPGALQINAAAGTASITVQRTSALTSTTITTGPGDVVSLGLAPTSLDSIAGPVAVNGQGGAFGTLNFEDQTTRSGRAYTLGVGSLTWGGAAIPQVTFSSLAKIVVDGTNFNDTFIVAGVPAATPVTLNGLGGHNTAQSMLPGFGTWSIYPPSAGATTAILNNQVTFAQAWNLIGGPGGEYFRFLAQGGVNGGIGGTIDGGGGANALDYSDPSFISPDGHTGVTVQLANSPAVGTATGTGGVLNIQGVVGSRHDDTLIGNDQNNTFQTYGGRDVLQGNGGDDVFRIVGPAQDPASILDGGSGSNTLWASDGTNTWTLTGPGAGTIVSDAYTNGNPLSFSNMQQLLGGLRTDVFKVLPGASFTYLNGNQGVNWLDYSAYTDPVTVNLATYMATGVTTANARFIQNVIGSPTAVNALTGNADPLGNILVGGAANDTITGGNTRSILIGGQGNDVLTGGTGDDIVIGGFTDYDQNKVALQAILNEWLSTTDDYLTRISAIRAGISVGGNSYFLVWGTGAGTTVHDDSGSNGLGADTLRGDPLGSSITGADWFFANQDPAGVLDTILDLQNPIPGTQISEKVNNQP
jgi:hypothetical protein